MARDRIWPPVAPPVPPTAGAERHAAPGQPDLRAALPPGLAQLAQELAGLFAVLPAAQVAKAA